MPDHIGLNHLFSIGSSDLYREGHTDSDNHQNKQNRKKVGGAMGVMCVHCHTNSFNQLS